MRTRRNTPVIVALALSVALTATATGASADAAPRHHYRPKRVIPSSLEPYVTQITPGHDAFPEEKVAEEISLRLAELGSLLQEGRAAEAVGRLLLSVDFQGGSLAPKNEISVHTSPAFEVFRARALSQVLDRDAGRFLRDLEALIAGLFPVRVAEFLITAIEVQGDTAVTEVRYDLVGEGSGSWRGQRNGRWRMKWRRSDGAWRIAQWTTLEDRRSRASAPVFVETTEAALGGNPSFRKQLGLGMDEWLGRLDAAFLPSGMGHHGVSAGDTDGDGRDDLYVAQPAGLPGRLFRNRGDGTFEDVTEAAGLLVLDSTSQSLFADVDNDGDQDLLLVTRTGLVLFANDGKGRFTPVADAFRFSRPLRGSPTSVSMADYDRDGFLDLYLCTYSFFIGQSEDKAGTPTPYHDAVNGPPDVLFRNDGRGRFLDVTTETGLDENNDRFGFAAAWGDYDDDGWPDLLVANDFGRKNLYRNLGRQDGKVRFRDVAKEAGVEDHGAGMSAAFFDYDNDGRLDIYTGNMWSAAGRRVTALPGFKPDAPAEVRELYERHARGNSLFRNKGDGTFEDVSLRARAEMGRWAWSSDAIDYNRDGFEDVYVVNGMFTRAPGEADVDLDSFFWRQVTARSPLTLRRGTPFDDAWRATNRLLAENGSQARHERNVLLRNDGQGGFDDVSGSVGLDLDQDGRSFAVLDYDQDGDPDLAVMAARGVPQLRLFRNDFAEKNAGLVVRLVGMKGNRDAVGARVIVETDRLRVMKHVQAGSGFISQHSKELLFGLGKSERIVKLTVRWPDGETQVLTDVPLDRRIRIEEGNPSLHAEAFRSDANATVAAAPTGAPAASDTPVSTPSGTWLYRSYPAPEFRLPDLEGKERSLSGLSGRNALLLFWATTAPPSVRALEELARRRADLAAAGLEVLAVAVDATADEAKVRSAARGLEVPVLLATEEMAGAYSVLSRYLFDRREDLRLPTALLIDDRGDIAKVYRDQIAADEIVADASRTSASPAERLARAAPFSGTFLTAPGERNFFQYSLDLAEQGYEAAALAGFERAAKLDPSAITFYNLGTLSMKGGRPAQARAAFERALALQPEYPEVSNSLGALLAQSGELPAAVARFQQALEGRPDFPDALNNLGFALFQQGQDQQAYELFQKALALQPEFPEAFNNLGIFFGEQGDLERAEAHFRKAVETRPSYGEAANNLALVLAAKGDTRAAITTLQRLIEGNPAFEMAYVTLSRVYLEAGQRREGVQVLELLLQRNPKSEKGLAMLKQVRGGA
jgi:tetratricopeptide (TPR) repeat protein